MTKFEKQMIAKLLAIAMIVSAIVGIDSMVSVKAADDIQMVDMSELAQISKTDVESTEINTQEIFAGEKTVDQTKPEQLETEGYIYHLDEAGNAIVDGYNGPDTTLVIPQKLGGNTVTEIGEKAFYKDNTIESVDIPNTVTKIQYCAFSDTKNLKSVTFKEGSKLRAISEQAFSCSGINTIDIPGTVDTIGSFAFFYSDIKSATIPKGVTEIENGVFDNCASLEKVELNYGIKRIGEYSFFACKSLKELIIPDSVTEIADLACASSGVVKLQLSNSLENIKYGAFEYCHSLENVVIPDSVKEIGVEAFEGCDNLKYVKTGKNLNNIGDSAFRDCPLLENVELSQGSEVVERMAFVRSGIKKLTLPDSVTEIQYHAFYTDTLEVVNCPKNLKKLSAFAFSDNSKWYLSQPDGVVYLGTIAYNYKSNMPDNYTLSLKDGTTAIAEAGFLNQPVVEVNIPNSVTYIGDLAFANCSELNEIEIPYGVDEIGKYSLGYKVYQYSQTGSGEHIQYYDPAYGLWNKKIKCDNFTIKGYSGTASERYAKENGFSFIDISPTAISVDKVAVSLRGGESVQLNASVTASDAAHNKKVYWSTSDSGVATVTDGGLVTANGYGTAVITAKTVNGLTASCTVTSKGPGVNVKYEGVSLSIKDNIGVNFYTKLSSEDLNNKSAYMRFTLEDGTIKDVKISDARTIGSGKNICVFTCDMPAAQMGDTIAAQFIVPQNNGSEVKSKEITYSVKEYCKYVIDNKEKFDASAVEIVKKLLNYGAYSQNYFDYKKSNLVNDLLTTNDKALTCYEELKALKSTYQVNKVSGITCLGSSLLLKSKTTLRCYFTIDSSKNISDYKFTVGNQILKPVKKDGKYYIDLTGILPANYSKSFTINVNGKAFVTCSVNDYCNKVLNSKNSSNKLSDLVTAIYELGTASK